MPSSRSDQVRDAAPRSSCGSRCSDGPCARSPLTVPTPLKTRVLLADDHAVVRSGLRAVLEAEPDIEVVAEAQDGMEAVEKTLSEAVDLAILDVSMPKLTGLQATAELRRRRR